MKLKKYNCGVVVGRFAPIHIGHESIIKRALKECKKVVLIVTSNNKKDENNPFDMKFKIYLIREAFENEIKSGDLIISTLYENGIIDTSYGDKILKLVKDISSYEADYIIYGSDKDINKCFSAQAIQKLNKVEVNRKDINISATSIREFLKVGDSNSLKKYLNPIVYDKINLLYK